jgi:hypothetical protein
MKKRSKRRAWSTADVRILKAGAKKKTRAVSLARSLKGTEVQRGKRLSALGCRAANFKCCELNSTY